MTGTPHPPAAHRQVEAQRRPGGTESVQQQANPLPQHGETPAPKRAKCRKASQAVGTTKRQSGRSATDSARLKMAAGHDFGLEGPLQFDSDYVTY